MQPRRRRILLLLAVLHLAAAGAGVAAGIWISRELPSIGGLDLLRLPQMTVLLDRRGERLHSFAEQRRIPVTLNQISPHFINALLATEDSRFYHHFGIDLRGVSRAALGMATSLRWGAQGGGSTITQQLARDQFLSPRKTITRKLQEMVLALTIEKSYTKREILELYCNRINFGHGRYGVEAAAQFYFGKNARDLTLAEGALLAGLPQRPEGYSPIKFPNKALTRRNHVLSRMVEEGVIDRRTAAEASRAPLGLVKPSGRGPAADYFVEEVRRFLLKQFGEDALYRSGLIVRTTLDPALQSAAERAVRIGLDGYGRRHRLLPEGHALPSAQAAGEYVDPAWLDPLTAGDIAPALVESSGPAEARVRMGDDRFTLTAEEISWTGRKVVSGVLVPGRLYPVKVVEVRAGRPRKIELAADPPVEAALIALDAATGDVLALVGGREFDRSEFDRAMQAQRQAGSAFKPFIYAAALEKGIRPSQLIWDVPTVLLDAGAPAPYQPENYDAKYEGLITLQHALEHSRNIPTVRLLDAIGYQPAVEMGRRLGLHSDLKPYPSLALGAFEVRLSELVAAYGAFVNGGVLVTPALVRSVQSADGQELWTASTQAQEVLSPELAAAMVTMLEGSTTRGTAAEAVRLGRPTMGKTGTTDDFTDAWFIGATPALAAGAWIGYDQRQSLGRGETGARAALPIWMEFVGRATDGQPAAEFARPAGAPQVLIDLDTGLRSRPESDCEKPVLETFPPGQTPPPWCTAAAHRRARLPYPLQYFPIRVDGALMIPPAEAAELVSLSAGRFEVAGAGREIRFHWGDVSGSAPLAWSSPDWTKYLQLLSRHGAARAAGLPGAGGETRFRFGTWRGLDGWPAEVVDVNRTGAQRPIDLPVDP